MPRSLPRLVALSLLACLATAPARAAEPARYALDPVHTRVLFAISHAGFSQALGSVSGSTGVLDFDPDDWRSARLEVSVPLARLDLGDAKWNAAVLERKLLDAGQYPVATFVSTRIEPKAADAAAVCGDLTLRGVTGEICLEVTLNALKRHPLPPFRRTAGFSATATLNRHDFGIDAWKDVIGDCVELRIEAEVVRETGRDDRDAAPELQPPHTDTPP
jgi:polyisoprenoid-binding protein YceI